MEYTPVNLAAKKECKDVILTLTQRGVNLDLVNAVSLLEDTSHYNV